MIKSRTAQQDEFLRTFSNARERVTLVENWLRKPGLNADIQNSAEATRMIANPDFEVLGTNASSDDVTLSTGGGIKLQTDGAASDSVIVLPHLDTNQTAWSVIDWSTDDEVAFAAKLVTGSSIADVTIWCGLKLTNTSVVATDDDQVFFRYQDSQNSGKWECIYSVGGTDYEMDSGVEVEASTAYDLVIAIDADRIARFFINGDLVHTAANALTSAVDLIPYTGVLAGAAAAKDITIRPGYTISKTQND